MAVLPSIIQKILSEETDVESPVSEALAQKIGSSINGLIDLNGIELFTSSGTWAVPSNVSRAIVFGAGGGGGGSGAIASFDGFASVGGIGGCGAVPTSAVLDNLNDGEIYNITIGAGGVGGPPTTTLNTSLPSPSTGGAGGNTIITGPSGTITFRGAPGGRIYTRGSATSLEIDVLKLGNFLHILRQCQTGGLFTVGGLSARLIFNGNVSTIGLSGNNSMYGVGGSVGSSGSYPDGAGGGGGAGFGNGANGGNGGPTTVGSNAAANSSAGGGGGGGNFGAERAGGNGGSGILWIIW